MCFDDLNVNVCAGKPVTGSLQYTADVSLAGYPYSLAMGNNMVVGDMEATYGDLTHSIANGGTWQVDLGGMYNVRRVLFFNRPSAASRASGAVVRLLNNNGWTVGQVTLNSNNIQGYDITLFPFSNTPTQTPTTSGTATSTATPTSSPSQTASASATLSAGAAPSLTATSTVTASQTASPTSTPSQTPTATGTALLPIPGSVRVSVFDGNYLVSGETYDEGWGGGGGGRSWAGGEGGLPLARSHTHARPPRMRAASSHTPTLHPLRTATTSHHHHHRRTSSSSSCKTARARSSPRSTTARR